MAQRRLFRSVLAISVAAAPIALSLVARPAPAGPPPGPWVFVPPPSGPSASSAKSAPSASTSAGALSGVERARRATVVIERNKKPIALGVVLSERSVVLTARSPISATAMTSDGADVGELEVRFPEGGSTRARVFHESRAWDLALLSLETTKWSEGVAPSEADPLSASASVSTFVLLKNGKLQPQPTAVLGRREYVSPDGDVIKEALSIDTKNVSIGTPLVDASSAGGGVVAMIARACAPGSVKVDAGEKGSCTPTLFGAPLAAIRAFLRTAPAIPRPMTPWLGVVGVAEPLGVRVSEVKPGSPAALAGIKGGDASVADVIIAADGAVVRSIDDLQTQIRKHAAGELLHLLVARAGLVREVNVTLRNAEEPPSEATRIPVPPLLPSAYLPLPPLPALPPPPKVVLKPSGPI